MSSDKYMRLPPGNGNAGLPAAGSATEIKDSLDFKTIICHNLRQGGRVLSHYFAETFILLVFDMYEGKDGKKK